MASRKPNPIPHDPPRPGEVLRELYLAPLGLNVTETARRLGVSRTALSQLLNGRSRMSLEMAARLAKAFGTSVELWLNLEHQRTLWQARRHPPRVNVRRIAKTPGRRDARPAVAGP